MKLITSSVNYPWLIPTLIFSILVILGSLAHPLWGDEAETALFARNILKYGLPKGWDGVNIMGINNAVVLDKNLINHTSPWAQYYLTAASFAVFGQSSLSARLPFILISILSLPLIYCLVLEITGKKRVAFLTLLILSLMVPHILFAYQARYYALTTFTSLLLVFCTLKLLEPKLWPKIGFITAGTIYFYANYVSFVAFFIATIVAFFVYLILKKAPRQTLKKYLFHFLTLSAAIAALTLAWYLQLQPFEGRGQITFWDISNTVYGMFIFIKGGIYPYNNNGAFPILFLILLIIVFLLRMKRKAEVSSLLLIVLIPLFFLIVMAVFSLYFVVDTNFVHIRYTMVVLPYLAMVSAYLINDIFELKKSIAVVVLFLYLTSNLFTLQRPRSFLVEYFKEIKNPYQTPDKIVADYLKVHAKNGETAFVNLDRDHEPLIFHLGDMIRFVNRVSLVNTRIFPENRSKIPRYVYDFREGPDWVIFYSKRIDNQSFLTFDARPLPPEVNLTDDYEEIILPVFFADASRPEIELRSFTEIKPAYNDQVFIYKKIKND